MTIGMGATTADWPRTPRLGLRGPRSPVHPATFASRAVRHVSMSCRTEPRPTTSHDRDTDAVAVYAPRMSAIDTPAPISTNPRQMIAKPMAPM